MTNETTYLENLLNNRKVVRNYKKTSLEDTKLKNISKFSILMSLVLILSRLDFL